MSSSRKDMMSYKDFLEKSKKPFVRPQIWKWDDIESELQEALSENFLSGGEGGGRGTIALVNEDTGDSYGVSPTMNMVAQVFEPGEHNKPHRHTNTALSIIVKGEGYSIVDGEKIEWKAGDVFIAPPWTDHEHCNTSETEQAMFFTIQDVPVVSMMGTWFRESPEQPQSHIVADAKEKSSK